MGKYHMIVTESQRYDSSHRMIMSQSQHMTKKLADRHKNCGRQDA